jgi:hypothetical protein
VAAFSLETLGKITPVLDIAPSYYNLSGDQFHDNEEVEMTIYKRLQMQELGFHHSRIFQHVPTWNISVNVLMD